jgi:hypothetical protein
MKLLLSLRPYVFPISLNLILFTWTWLGVNQGKGLFYFTTDELGLMLLLPLAMLLNGLAAVLALCWAENQLAKTFGILSLVLFTGCTAVWVHGYQAGVAS